MAITELEVQAALKELIDAQPDAMQGVDRSLLDAALKP